MLDLKPLYDAVIAADGEVQRVASDIRDLFAKGDEESTAQALALRPALDEAQSKYDAAAALYESMQKANRPNDIAKNFIPVSNTTTDPADNSQPTTIKRAAYDQMSLVDRAKFIRSGGTVTDKED